jgi:hypothetical protein
MLPNQVRIKPRITYERVFQELIGDDPNTIGYCDSLTRHLYIKLNLSKRLEEETEAHELLHAIADEYGVKIAHSELDKLATAIIKVMRLNGWLPK